MGVRSRIEDAVFLWQNERREGALLSVLVAVAATSRRRYPHPEFTDRDAFIKFVADSYSGTLGAEYRGEVHNIETIVYKWLRCELAHEAALPTDIQFFEAPEGMLSIRAGGAPEYTLKLSNSWIWHLVNAVSSAPENKSDFDACEVRLESEDGSLDISSNRGNRT